MQGFSKLYILFFFLGISHSVADCTSKKHLEKHIDDWVNKVPYSHLKNKEWGYPTDCSGFVSWVLQTKDLKAYDYASSKYSSEIDIDDLQFGDIITHVFDKSSLKRCEGKEKETFIAEADSGNNATFSLENSEVELSVSAPWDYLSGHVFFFDKWENDKKENFWAYESSETQDQTKECRKQTNSFTRSKCLNHHVLKSRKVIEKYSKDNCKVSKYSDHVKGGARRLSHHLLCEN